MINKIQYIQKEAILDGVKMDKLHVVGQVVEVVQIKQTYQFTLDDGTDLIKINEAELIIKEYLKQGRNVIQLGNYLSCIFEIE